MRRSSPKNCKDTCLEMKHHMILGVTGSVPRRQSGTFHGECIAIGDGRGSWSHLWQIADPGKLEYPTPISNLIVKKRQN